MQGKANDNKQNQNYLSHTQAVIKKSLAADPVVQYMSKHGLKKAIEKAKKQMEKASKNKDYTQATIFRDEMFELQKLFDEKF